jgi:hypothetical protein
MNDHDLARHDDDGYVGHHHERRHLRKRIVRKVGELLDATEPTRIATLMRELRALYERYKAL